MLDDAVLRTRCEAIRRTEKKQNNAEQETNEILDHCLSRIRLYKQKTTQSKIQTKYCSYMEKLRHLYIQCTCALCFMLSRSSGGNPI